MLATWFQIQSSTVSIQQQLSQLLWNLVAWSTMSNTLLSVAIQIAKSLTIFLFFLKIDLYCQNYMIIND